MQLSRRGFVKAAAAGMANLAPNAWPEPAAEESYIPEANPLVLKKLDQWRDWKFGFMAHWRPHSEWGVVEFWSICSEDVPWCKRPAGISYVDYVKKYEQLPRRREGSRSMIDIPEAVRSQMANTYAFMIQISALQAG